MCFESVDCTVHCISSMDMGWYKLVSHSQPRLYDALVFSTFFIVQYLEVYEHVVVFKPLYDGTLGKEAVFFGVVLEGKGNDGIGITMVCYNCVLVSTW